MPDESKLDVVKLSDPHARYNQFLKNEWRNKAIMATAGDHLVAISENIRTLFEAQNALDAKLDEILALLKKEKP